MRRLLLAAALLLPVPAVAAFTITGKIINEAGTGLANVDIDFIDQCSGDNVFLVNDKTAADGTYSIVVNPGTYDVHYTPATGSVVTGAERPDYVVAAGANLGTIVLHPGWLVSGTVKTVASAGIANVDLKWVSVATGQKVWVGKDVTSALGAYSMRVPPGTYDVEFRPPAGQTFITGRRKNLVVVADVSGLADVLPTGFEVSGRVKDSSSNVQKNVDLNFYDECTGAKIPTSNDNSDLQGNYSVYVPTGTYSIHYNPPRCKSLASERIAGVAIDRNQGINNVILPPGLLVTGRVLDNLALPLANAKLKFYDAVSGARQAATNDDTMADGTFSVLVPTGTYGVNVEPPASRDLLVTRLDNLGFAASLNLGDLTLAAGNFVAGLVLGPGSAPVRNVNINVLDSVTRSKLHLAHDSSAIDGTFRVVAPSGTFDVQYDPPACTGDAPADQKAVLTAGPTTLPTMHLVTGVHAMGRAVDDAVPPPNPVGSVDLDFFVPGTRTKYYTPGDHTKIDGIYGVLVQPGTYDIDFTPPAGSPLRPAQRFNQAVPVDTTFVDVVLTTGVLVSGTVHVQTTGFPVDNVAIGFFPPGSPSALVVAHNSSDVTGAFNVAVDPGTWDLYFDPALGSGLAPRWRRGVVALAATAIGDTLLLPLTVPGVSTASPSSGTTAGGQTVTISGTGFQPDATLTFGGVAATGVVVASAASLTAVTPHHPAGAADVVVVNPGSQNGTLATGYMFVEPASGVHITVTRSGSDLVLTWPATGQASYTIYRNAHSTGFTGANSLSTTAGTSYTDVGAASSGSTSYYQVD